MRRDFGIDPIEIDVGMVLQRSVASLYSHLVTRPTGRAVRLAIESQLAEAERPSVSMIDLSEVTILDFSCADEVVAKLLLRFLRADRPSEAFFVFRGVSAGHLDQIETVLVRQKLLAVSESAGQFYLIGAPDALEDLVWRRLEGRGTLSAEEVGTLFESDEEREALESLVQRRVAFRVPEGGTTLALSSLMQDLL
jgi:hypothetical protein